MRTIFSSSCASSFVPKKANSHKELSVNKTVADTYIEEDEEDEEEEELAQFYQPLADPVENSSADVESLSKKSQTKNLISVPRKDTQKRSDPLSPAKAMAPLTTTTTTTVTPDFSTIAPLDMIQFPHVEPPMEWMNASPTDWNLDTDTCSRQNNTTDAFFPPWTIAVGISTDALDENVPVDVDTNEKWSPDWSFEMSMSGADNPFLTTPIAVASKDVASQDTTEQASKKGNISPSSSSKTNKSLTLGILAQISGLMDYQEDTGQYYQGTDINYVEPDVSDSEVEKAVLATISFDSHEEKEQISINTYTSRGSKSHNSSGLNKGSTKDVAQEIQFDMNIDDCTWSDILDQSYDSDLPRLLQSYSKTTVTTHELSKVISDVTPKQKQQNHHRNISNGSKDLNIAQFKSQDAKEVEKALIIENVSSKIERSNSDVKVVEPETPVTQIKSSSHEMTYPVSASSVKAKTESTATLNNSSSGTFPWKANLKPRTSSVLSNSPRAVSTTVSASPIESLVPSPLPTAFLSPKNMCKSISQQPSSTTQSTIEEVLSFKEKESDEKSSFAHLKVTDKSFETTEDTRMPETPTSIDEEANKPFDQLLARYNRPKTRGRFKPGLEQLGSQIPGQTQLLSNANTINKDSLSTRAGKLDPSKTSVIGGVEWSNPSGRETPLTSHLSSDSHPKEYPRQGLTKPDSTNTHLGASSTEGTKLKSQENFSGQRRKTNETVINVQLKPIQVPRNNADTVSDKVTVGASWMRPNSPQSGESKGNKVTVGAPWMRSKSPQSSEPKQKSFQLVKATFIGESKTNMAVKGHPDSKFVNVRDATRIASPNEVTNEALTIASKVTGLTSVANVHVRYSGKSNLSHESSTTLKAPTTIALDRKIRISDTPTQNEKRIDRETKTATMMQTFETELVETQDSSKREPIITRSFIAAKLPSADSKNATTISQNVVNHQKDVLFKGSKFITPPLKPTSSKPSQADVKTTDVQDSGPNTTFNYNLIPVNRRAQSPGPVPNASTALEVAKSTKLGSTKLTASGSESNNSMIPTPINLLVKVEETSVNVTPITSNNFQRNQISSHPYTPQQTASTDKQTSWVRSKPTQPNTSPSSEPSWTLPHVPKMNSSSTLPSKISSIRSSTQPVKKSDMSPSTAAEPSIATKATMKDSVAIIAPYPVLSYVDDRLVAPSSVKMNRRDERVTSETKQITNHLWMAKKEAMLDNALMKEEVPKPVFSAPKPLSDNMQQKQQTMAPIHNQSSFPPSSTPAVKNKIPSLTALDQSVFSPSAVPAIRVKRTTSVVSESVSLSTSKSFKTKSCPEPTASSSEPSPISNSLTSRIAVFEKEKKQSLDKGAISRKITTI